MVTSPNQRIVKIKLQKIEQGDKDPYLHIKRTTLEQACRDLKTATAISVYLYLASNRDDFTLGFSPKAIAEAYGISEDSARSGFNKLIEKGYVLPSGKNHYTFYNIPKSKITTSSEKRKHFRNDETGEIIAMTYQELVEAVGDKTEADNLWKAQED